MLPTAISPSLTPFDLDVPHDHDLAHDAHAHALDTHVPSRPTPVPSISTCMRTLDTHGQAGRVTHWMPRLRHPLPRLNCETEGVLLILSCQCIISPLASNARRKGLSRSRQHLYWVCPRLRLCPAHTHKIWGCYHSQLLTISALTALVSHTPMPSTPTPTMRT